MAPQVDPLSRRRDTCHERVDERVVVTDEREDRAVVIAIRVDVEQRRAPAREGRREDADLAASRPSETFGTDSRGSTRLLYGRCESQPPPRTTTGAHSSTTTGTWVGLYQERDRPGFDIELVP